MLTNCGTPVRSGAAVTLYDPEAMDDAQVKHPEIGYRASAVEAARGADVVLHLTEWSEFREMDPTVLSELRTSPSGASSTPQRPGPRDLAYRRLDLPDARPTLNPAALRLIGGKGLRVGINEGYSMRVLHVLASIASSAGGPSHALAGLVAAANMAKDEPRVLTTNRGLSGSPPVALDCAVRVLPTTPPHVRGVSLPLWQALPDELAAADVVHLHSLYLFHTWAAMRLAARLNVPVVLRPHGTLDRYHTKDRRLAKTLADQTWHRAVFREARIIHCTSAKEVTDSRLSMDPRVRVVPLPFIPSPDVSYAPRAEFRARWGIPEAARVLLFMGRLTAKKRLDLTISALSHLPSDVHLLVVGPDFGAQERAERLVAAQDLAGRVHFTGGMFGPQKMAALAASDAFVLLSESENFGYVILEALAAGLPVVLTREVALADGAISGDAILITDGTVEGAADMLHRATMVKLHRPEMTRIVEQAYGASAVAPQLHAMYDAASR